MTRLAEYYKDRYSVEFPTIFSLCCFKNKSILEIGSGREGYFIIDALKLTDRIVASDISSEILDDLKKNVNVETKVCNAENLPFSENSFDIVSSRWVVQYVEDLEKAVKEMCRVARDNVIIVLPSEEGDETKILQIKYPDKLESRKKRIETVKKWICECGFKVKEERRSLNFLFPDLNETVEIFSVLGFRNKATAEEKLKLKEYLLSKKSKDGINFCQGSSFICGYR